VEKEKENPGFPELHDFLDDLLFNKYGSYISKVDSFTHVGHKNQQVVIGVVILVTINK
jgi:hypothetical protein